MQFQLFKTRIVITKIVQTPYYKLFIFLSKFLTIDF
jgi:hypothetical protein